MPAPPAQGANSPAVTGAAGGGVNYASAGIGAAIKGYEITKMPAGKGQAQAIGAAVAGTAIAVTGAAGAVAGAVGVAAGAAAGALAGSVVPIVGTIIGALAGALISGMGGGKLTQKHGRFSVAGETKCVTALVKREHWAEADAEELYFVDKVGGTPPAHGAPHWRNYYTKKHGPQLRWEQFSVPLPDGTQATFGRPSGLAPGAKKAANAAAGGALMSDADSAKVVVVGLAAVAVVAFFIF